MTTPTLKLISSARTTEWSDDDIKSLAVTDHAAAIDMVVRKYRDRLFRVTSNLCFNRVRDRKRRGVLLETFPLPDRTRGDQIERVFGGERRDEMLRAIDGMSRAHREILMLRYYDDLSYAEIASVLELKLGTVMSRLSRARGRLLEAIGEADDLRA